MKNEEYAEPNTLLFLRNSSSSILQSEGKLEGKVAGSAIALWSFAVDHPTSDCSQSLVNSYIIIVRIIEKYTGYENTSLVCCFTFLS